MRTLFFLSSMLLIQMGLFCNSINLMNNTTFKLKAVIIAANGEELEEVTLDSRTASMWSDDFYQYGHSPSSSMTPYTVNWYCMKGQSFGVCTNVSPGSVVLAQNCSGAQECPQND